MVQFTTGSNEDGKRVDAVVAKLLPGAGKGFIYKMLRKKNIVVNDKKAEGSDRLKCGDVIGIYLSDETYRAFGGGGAGDGEGKEDICDAGNEQDILKFRSLIIYEDDDIMLINKPAGMLSQKAGAGDVSVNDLMIGYLLREGKTDKEALKTFRPSVCNRLDRNTSGIVCAGVSLKGSRELTRLIRERRTDKYYVCIVCGELRPGKKTRLRSFLSKDEKANKVRVSDNEFEGSVPVEIEYRPIGTGNGYTLLEVRLITGKSHQIRAQLAHIGHPIAGDAKYGNGPANDRLRRAYGVKRQLLTALSFTFPEDTTLEQVKGRTFTIDYPEDFFLNGNMEFEGTKGIRS